MGRWTTEGYFSSCDHMNLFYRIWKPEVSASKSLIVIHRGHEHPGDEQELAESPDSNDSTAFSWYARGHGSSSAEDGYAESYDFPIRDLDKFNRIPNRQSVSAHVI